jgi:hypothetical protein
MLIMSYMYYEYYREMAKEIQLLKHCFDKFKTMGTVQNMSSALLTYTTVRNPLNLNKIIT